MKKPLLLIFCLLSNTSLMPNPSHLDKYKVPKLVQVGDFGAWLGFGVTGLVVPGATILGLSIKSKWINNHHELFAIPLFTGFIGVFGGGIFGRHIGMLTYSKVHHLPYSLVSASIKHGLHLPEYKELLVVSYQKNNQKIAPQLQQAMENLFGKTWQATFTNMMADFQQAQQVSHAFADDNVENVIKAKLNGDIESLIQINAMCEEKAKPFFEEKYTDLQRKNFNLAIRLLQCIHQLYFKKALPPEMNEYLQTPLENKIEFNQKVTNLLLNLTEKTSDN